MEFLKTALSFVTGGASFLFGHIKLIAVGLAVVGLVYSTYHFVNEWNTTKNDLKTAQAAITQLNAEKTTLQADNTKLVANMKALKDLHDTFVTKTEDNAKTTKSLGNTVTSQAFKDKASKDTKAATVDFNNAYNQYMHDINAETGVKNGK